MSSQTDSDLQVVPNLENDPVDDHDSIVPSVKDEDVIAELSAYIESLELPNDFDMSRVSKSKVALAHSEDLKTSDGMHCSWHKAYPMLLFLISGHTYTEYFSLGGLLGLQPCSDTEWIITVDKLAGILQNLAELSCTKVQEEIKKRGNEAQKWVAIFDYYDNGLGTLRDFITGKIAYFYHIPEGELSHNWSETSGEAEYALVKMLGKAKEDCLEVERIVTNRQNSSMNEKFCSHFYQSMVKYCSNAEVRTLQEKLERIIEVDCECSEAECKQMSKELLSNCKSVLANLIASKEVQAAKKPVAAFVEGIWKFYDHYCHGDMINLICKVRVKQFQSLIEGIAAHPETYVSDQVQWTADTVDSSHDLPLAYGNYQTDLSQKHNSCKITMAICYKNLGPIWKFFCLTEIGVDVPANAIVSILNECQHATTKLESPPATTELESPPATNELESQPFLILYDCETTGLNVYKERIIDIGAKIFDPPVPICSPTFSRLVKTEKIIPQSVAELTGISDEDLQNEERFPVVFLAFMEWLDDTVACVTDQTQQSYYPVLVAHNGNMFDFPILFAEIQRYEELDITTFESRNIRFSDTLTYFQELKKRGDPTLQNTKLKVEELYKKACGTDMRNAHRALPDVEALEEILQHQSFQRYLSNLTVKTPQEQIAEWNTHKDIYWKSKELQNVLKLSKYKHAKKLVAENLTFDELVHICQESTSDDDFNARLKIRSIGSKTLCKELWRALRE